MRARLLPVAVAGAVAGCGGAGALSEGDDRPVRAAVEQVDTLRSSPDEKGAHRELTRHISRLEEALSDERSDTVVPSLDDKPVGDLLAGLSLDLSDQRFEDLQRRVRDLRQQTQENAGKEVFDFRPRTQEDGGR